MGCGDLLAGPHVIAATRDGSHNRTVVLDMFIEAQAQCRACKHVAVCRQSISDSWLGNLRECLAHLV
jgi:hypothetical protein